MVQNWLRYSHGKFLLVNVSAIDFYFVLFFEILTDQLREKDICTHLHDKLDRFIVRRGALPLADNDRFLQIFSQLKYLQINLHTIDDLRRIALKFIKMMHRLLTLQIYLLDIEQTNDIPQWEGIMNHISYEIAKRYVKIWK